MKRVFMLMNASDNRGHWYAQREFAEMPEDQANDLIENGAAITDLDYLLGELKQNHDFVGFVTNGSTSDEFKKAAKKHGYSIKSNRGRPAKESEFDLADV